MSVMADFPYHRFVVLTKAVAQALAFLKGTCTALPDNLWLGVSVDGKYVPSSENGLTLADWLSRVAEALEFFYDKTRGKTVICFEPLLAGIPGGFLERLLEKAGWVVVGGQIEPVKYPLPEWVEDIVYRSRERGIPVFVRHSAGPSWVGRYTERPEEVASRRRESGVHGGRKGA